MLTSLRLLCHIVIHILYIYTVRTQTLSLFNLHKTIKLQLISDHYTTIIITKCKLLLLSSCIFVLYILHLTIIKEHRHRVIHKSKS